MTKKLLVVGAHSADYVWRAGGTIAKVVEQGGEVLNLALSYGERGESGVLWKENPNRSVEEVKQIRHEMSVQASAILGCEFKCLDGSITLPGLRIPAGSKIFLICAMSLSSREFLENGK